MKKFIASMFLSIALLSCGSLGNLSSLSTPLTEEDAAQGIREALDQGVGRGISLLNRTDGFFNHPTYKLLLPPEAERIENSLRQLGMGGMIDKAIMQINRAAEDAVGYARPIFLDAIRGMTVADAIGIVRGTNDAATQYFRQKTTERLIAAFTPIVKTSLDRFNATKYYSDVISTYNNFPTTINKVNPDLPSYVVSKAVDALFDQIAQEEANIRANPVARTTEILKRVFGRAGR
ncbi:MAG TPA: DUF4197 domain-containing protein [Chitinophagaceae bacterium]|jgi:hypothetical protein|nr:DUF4197 domain-containing protein [Chitinophagaceae bacterium]